jgi:hypothetical protein
MPAKEQEMAEWEEIVETTCVNRINESITDMCAIYNRHVCDEFAS